MSRPIYKNLRTCLVVDDDPVIRESLEMLLESNGLNCHMAANGREAVALLRTFQPDILVSDFRMPFMNGVQLLAWCRASGLHMPVILLSANADLLEAEELALGDCCATLMTKPVNVAMLMQALEAADKRVHHQDCVHKSHRAVAAARNKAGADHLIISRRHLPRG